MERWRQRQDGGGSSVEAEAFVRVSEVWITPLTAEPDKGDWIGSRFEFSYISLLYGLQFCKMTVRGMSTAPGRT